MHPEKFEVDKIQNGRLSAIIHLDRTDIVEYHETAQDIYTITIKQIVRLQERMYFEKNHFVKVQNGRQSAIIHFHMAVIW